MPRVNNKGKQKNTGKLDDRIKNGVNRLSNRGKYLLAAIIIIIALAIIVLVAIHMANVISENSTKAVIDVFENAITTLSLFG